MKNYAVFYQIKGSEPCFYAITEHYDCAEELRDRLNDKLFNLQDDPFCITIVDVVFDVC